MRLTRRFILVMLLLSAAAVAMGLQVPPAQKPPERLLPTRGQTPTTGATGATGASGSTGTTGPSGTSGPTPFYIPAAKPATPPAPTAPAPTLPAATAPAPAPTPVPAPAPAPTPATTAAPAPAPAPVPSTPTASSARVSGSVSVIQKDGSKKPGDGAIVYLETVDPSLWKDTKRATGGAPKLAMKGKQFEPRAVAVLAGTSVAFPNQDTIFHNAFSLSGGNKFDLGLYKDGASKAQTFTQPGIVRVFCNIHPGMSASVLVLQNPFWAQVGADGTYSLADIPPGTWTLKVWHERGGEQQQPLVVTPGQRAAVSFELDGRKYKVVPHKNKFGKDYDSEGY